MSFKRLKEPTGEVTSGNQPSDSADKVVREAILVHTGPEAADMEFLSGDGPITFSAERIANVVRVHNAKVDALAEQYGGEKKIPTGAFEPILDMHEGTSMSDVIGRLTGRLYLETRDVPKVGKNVVCAVAKPGITFLGKEAVDRVKDGRIYHLSIGINESDDSLGETSAVIKPAAPGAMLLKHGSGGSNKPISKSGGKNPMSETLKRLQASHQSRLTKLTEMKTLSDAVNKKLVDTSQSFKMAARKDSVNKRLSKAIADRKMTPAEYREVIKEDGLTRLAKLDDETLKIALMPFEARQAPVIEAGQRGTTDAVDFGTIGQSLEKKQLKRMRSEIAKDFKKLSGKKMVDGEDKEHGEDMEMGGGNDLEPANPGKDPHSVPDQAGDEKQLKSYHMALAKHLAEGNVDGAKEEHGKIMAHMKAHGMKHMGEYTGDVKSEDEHKALADVQMQIDELNTQMARFSGMLEEQMGAEESEGHELKKHLEKEVKDEAGGSPAA